jgi:shikimate kinase
VSERDRPRHLVLVGMMGAGKSTVGKRCAHRLERAFVDTDEIVATVAGASVS